LEFKEGDVRPEHYFNCTAEDVVTGKKIDYVLDDQEIKYEVNYNQKLTVNTQAKDAIKTDMGRTIDDILDAVDSVKVTEDKIAEVAKRLEDTTLSDSVKQYYNELTEQLQTELTLKNEKLKNVFTNGIAVSKEQQNVVNVENSDLGSRYVRLQLIESRLETQSVQVEELMSNNEDVDLAEIIVRFSSAEALYNASLSATAKTVSNTLLDFL
jgi:flagellar hook-associated protein 3 FlgL